MIFTIFLVSVVGLFILGFPIVFAFISSSALYLYLERLNPSLIVQKLVLGTNSFVLLAVPFFIFAAEIMNSTGITKRIFSFAQTLVGHFPGSLAQVNIVDSIFFAGMSGSAIADASGPGLMEIEAMTSQGYDKSFAAAVSASSSTVGPIIPPSIPMILYAIIAGASVGQLFLAGLLPGMLMGGAMMVTTYFIARRRGFQRDQRANLREIRIAFGRAFFALLTPVLLLGGIFSGVFTPTEAAAVTAFYALLIAFLIYREFTLKDLLAILKTVVVRTGFITFILITSLLLSWVVTREQVPARIAAWLLSVTDNKWVLLLILNILFLILGMVLDVGAIIVIFLPIVVPVVQAAGIDLVHFGVVVILNLMIGLITPPFGALLFVMNGLTKVPVATLVKEAFPYLVTLIIVLFTITYWEGFVLFLPRLLK
ncbi:MAG: TRAP transporter large permease [Candidatus Bipolaricaulia bacterium]